jgi:hypothetical protein
MRRDGFNTAQRTATAGSVDARANTAPSAPLQSAIAGHPRTWRDLGWVVACLLGGVLVLAESTRLLAPVDPATGASPLGRYLAQAAQALGAL